MNIKYTFFAAPLLVLLWAGCKDSKKDAAAAAPPPTPVSVVSAQMGTAVYYDKFQGTVVSLNNVELRAQISGFITGIFFKEGEIVKKGQLLYEIDKRKFEASYQQARANLSAAQANLTRAQKDADRYSFLLKQDAVARQTYDQAVAGLATQQSQVASARAGVESARADLSYSSIRAPFTGRIGISQVRLGAQVTPGTTLLNTISAENPMGVDIVINENSIPRFEKLQRNYTDSTFKLQLSDGTIYPKSGVISTIDRGVNNQTGTIKVRIKFDNNGDLKDGMSGVMQVLNSESGQRVLIPYKSVTEQMGEFFVFVSQDTIAKQRKVVLGPRISSNVVVMSGLEEGEKVITDGFQRLRDGGKIVLGPPPAAAGPDGKPATGGQGTEKPKQN